ncbi:hypothetical protein KSS94_06635 [Pseudomonas fakonensis]|uniref:WYL domain-containing protein n=1 Tax=Pseudomonas fakonensis TaxID=2842355 RepID=A0ABX8N926_9PSED|nr:hypothetical protein [Pseudomonas fakonensis]QXH52801.1 hypothetical protein KSS94_06635 [Pseudomonas fakonensis]
MQLNTHNARLKRTLQAARHASRTATTKEELLVAVDALLAFYGKMHYDNRLPWLTVVLGLPLLAASMSGQLDTWLPVLQPLADLLKQRLVELRVNLEFGLMAATVASALALWDRRKPIPNLAQALAERSSLITAGLVEIPVNTPQVLSMLQTRFIDYRRGEKKRYLHRGMQGRSQGPRYTLDYRWYLLIYDDEGPGTQEKLPDSEGSTRLQTKSSWNLSHRFSLVIDFPWVEGIALGSSRLKHRFAPTSSEFNNAFTLSGDSVIACARFAKPSTQLHLTRLSYELDAPSLQFSEGQLCLGCNNNPLHFELPCDLTQPYWFREFIAEGVQLPRLSRLLEAIHILAEQQDDNFNVPAPAPLHTEN